MKRIISAFIKRPLKNYNVENRAQKFVEKNEEKPKVAPRHPTTAKQIDDFVADNPDLLDEQKRKNEELHARLQGLIAKPDKVGEITSRPLPSNTKKMQDYEFGYLEPDTLPAGKCTIRQSLKFIGDHSSDKTEHTATKIANEYNLDINEVEQVLKYFHMYQLQVPKDPTKQEELPSGDSTLSKAKKLLSSKSEKSLPKGV